MKRALRRLAYDVAREFAVPFVMTVGTNLANKLVKPHSDAPAEKPEEKKS